MKLPSYCQHNTGRQNDNSQTDNLHIFKNLYLFLEINTKHIQLFSIYRHDSIVIILKSISLILTLISENI